MTEVWQQTLKYNDVSVAVRITERTTAAKSARPCDCTDCQFVVQLEDHSWGPKDPIGGAPKIALSCAKLGHDIKEPDPRCRHWRPQKPDYAKAHKRRMFRMAS